MLTGVTSSLAQFNVEWKRTRHASNLVKAFRKMRPAKPRPKRPWSAFHIRLAQKHAVSESLWDQACFVGMLLGWGALMRCSEFAKRHKSTPILTRGQIEFSPNDKRPNEAYITLFRSKTN